MSEVNLDCVRGDTASWRLTVVRDTVAIDLTTAEIWMTARRNRGGSVVFTRTESDGITIDPDQASNPGKAVIKLAVESTESLPAETVNLFYDIQIRVVDDVWTVNFGTLTVSADSTLET